MRASKKILGVIAGASMLATTLGIGTAAFAASATYYDIYDLTTLAQTAINSLYQDGVMNGTAPGKFSPTGAVTRAQAVKFVVNALGLQLQYPRTASYTDVTSGSQYYPYIETALNAGLLNGFAGSSGAFNPSEKVSRIDLAILEINALGDQSLATSMATDTTTYFGKGKLTDAAKVPSGDLGYANAGMKLGLVPPLNSSLYSPNGSANREQFAVGLYRLYGKLSASAPASLKVTSSATSVGVGQADNLTTTVLDAKGNTIPTSQLAGYTISYSVTGSNASSATVSSNGTFVATASGNYTVEASISGGALKAPVTTTVTVGVYGTATALKVTPASASVVADGTATDTVTVDVVDANGNTVGNFNGTVDVSDSVGRLLESDGVSLTSELTNVAVVNGVATVTVEADTTVAETQTLTAFGLTTSGVAQAVTSGTATITEVAAVPTQIGVAIRSGYPASIAANSANSTWITVTPEDAAGNPSTSGGYVTLTVSGPGTLNAAGGPTTETLYVSSATNVQVFSETGNPGSISISAASSGLTSGTLTIPTYVNTAPASLSVTSKSGTDASGEPYTLYTVQLLDTNGHPITSSTGYNDAISVTDNSAAQGGAITYGSVNSTTSVFSAGAAPTVLTNGSATFAVETASPGTSPVTITVKDTTSSLSQTATFSFATGKANNVTVTPVASVASHALNFKTEPGQNVTVQAQLVDAAGNAVAEAGQNVTFAFQNTPAAGITLPNGTNNVAYVASTNAQGIATTTINVANTTATGSSFVVTATFGTQTAVATGTITVEPGTDYATQVAISGAPTTSVQPGTISGTITATPENALAAVLSSPSNNDVLQITTSNSSVVALASPDQTGGSTETLTGGSTALTGQLVAEMAGTATVTVTDISNPAQPKASFTVNVVPSGSSSGTAAVEFNGKAIGASNPLSVTANTPVALTVVNVDAGGNPVPVTGTTALQVALRDTNGGGFRLSASGANVSDVQIPVGQTSVTVYYINPNSESITSGITAPDSVATTVTITPSSGGSITAGATTPISATVVDQYGNPMAGVSVAFATTLTNGALATSPATTNSSGVASVNLTDTHAGDTGSVSATANSHTATAAGFTVVAAVGAPTIGTATETSTGATVTWTAPSGTAPSSYVVLEKAAGAGSYTAVNAANGGTPAAGATSATITGLTAGTSYTFEVEAVDASGNDSAASAATSSVEYGFIASAAAAAHTTGFLTITTDKTPATAGATSDYVVRDTTTSTTLTVTAVAVVGGKIQLTVTGLVSGDTFTVTAANPTATDAAGAPLAPITSALTGTIGA